MPLTVATPCTLEFHAAWLVTSALVLSSKVALAVNACCVWPPEEKLMVALGGLTVMLLIVRLLTVNVAFALTLPDLAVMVVLPKATAVANPEVSMVAMLVADDVQVTLEVTSPVLLLPNRAVALNCCWVVGLIQAPVGEIERETMAVEDGKNPPQLLSRMARNTAALLPIMFGLGVIIYCSKEFP